MTVHRLTALCLLGAGMLFHDTSTSGQPEGGLGLIIAVDGDVSVTRAGVSKPAVEGFVLEPGDTIDVCAGGVCSGFRLDGSPFHVTGPDQLVLEISPGDVMLDRVREFIARQLAQWSGASRRQSLVSRGIRDWERVIQSPATLMPAPDGAVRTSAPRFYWTTIPNVDRYVVTIARDEGDRIRHTVRGHTMMAENLQPGQDYVWKVEAQRDDVHAVSNWSAFHVMTLADEEELDEALAGLSDLEAGVVLLSSGLHEEAIYRFDAAVDTGPQLQSALRWRARALAAIGLCEDAYEDLTETIQR